MKVLFFSVKKYEIPFLEEASDKSIEIKFIEHALDENTVELAKNFDAISCFVNDDLGQSNLKKLKSQGVKYIVLRCAGFNNLNVAAAEKLGLKVARVPKYSPYAVAEFALCLIMSLNRKVHRSYYRVKEFNFTLDGLVGFDLHGKTVGVVGTGRIGKVFSQICLGFGCKVLGFDIKKNSSLEKLKGFKYCDFETLLKESDIISLHVPLIPETHHLIDSQALKKTKKGVMIINTGRGALIDSKALVSHLKSEHIGSAGLDVYEEEEEYFFNDMSGLVMHDDVLARLVTFPNVILTSHQGFLTKEALRNIAMVTFDNLNKLNSNKEFNNLII